MAVNVEVNLRQKGGEDVSKAVRKLQTDFDNAGKAIDRSQAQAAGLKRELRDIGKALDTVDSTAFKQLDKDIDATAKSADKAAKSIQNMQTQAAQPIRMSGGAGQSDRLREFQRLSGDTAGDASTAIGGLASAASSAGFRGAGAIAALGDAVALGEELPRLTAGFAAMSPAVVTLTGVVVGFTAAAYLFNKALTDGAERIGKISDQIERRIRLEAEIEGLTAAQARERKTQLEQELEINKRLRDEKAVEFATEIANVQNFGDAVTTTFAGLSAALGVGDIGEFGRAKDEMQKLNDEADRLTQELAAVNAAIETNLRIRERERQAYEGFITAEQARIDAIIQNDRDIASLTSEAARQQRDEAEKRLTLNQELEKKITDDLTVQLQARVQAQDEFVKAVASGDTEAINQARDRLSIIDERIAVLGESLPELTVAIEQDTAAVERFNSVVIDAVAAREAETRALEQTNRARTAQENLLNKSTDALKKFNDIQAQIADLESQRANAQDIEAQKNAINARYDALVNAKDAEIEAAKAAEKQAQAQSKLTDLETDRSEKITELLSKARDTENQRQSEFGKELERFARDTAISAKRIFRDTSEAITEAVGDNDVVSFAKATTDRNNRLSDLAEDANNEAADRIRDFNDESIRLASERERQIQDIQRQYHEQRVQLEIQTRQQQISVVQQLEAQKAQLEAQRQMALAEFENQLEQEAFNARIKGLRDQAVAIQNEYLRLKSAAETVGRNIVTSVLNAAAQRIGEAYQSMARSQSSVPNRPSYTAYAEGGIISRPTIALMGERPGYSEAIIPFRRSEGIGAAMARQGGGAGLPPITIDMRYAQIGIDTSVLKAEIGHALADAIELRGA